MNLSKIGGFLTLMLVTFGAQAQLYKWVAPDGTVSYSDVPPPPTATKVERKNYGGGPSTADFPFELSNAVKNNPVTLYTMPNCSACDSGRKALNDRGIPFAEKTVTTNEDIERIRQISGGNQLPIVTIGRNKLTGFESGQWNTALTTAGYPASNILPPSYSNPSPEPAVPPAKVATDPNGTTPNKPAATQPGGLVLPPPATGNAPPDFKF